MPAPRVSILLPVRDASATLPACIASLRRQTLADWECILVDDGSRDASPRIARAAAAADPRLRVVTTEPRGLVAALDAGLAHCRAPVVARMDADDLAHRHRLARQCAALDADPSLAAVGCHVRLFPRARLTDGMRAYEDWLNAVRSEADVRAEAYVECPLAHPTWMLRSDTLRALPYRDFDGPEDHDLLLRWLGKGLRIGVVPQRLLMWREHARRLSRTDARYAQPRFVALKAKHLAADFLGGSDRYVLWGYGATGRTLCKALRAHGKRPAAIVEVHPRRLGNHIDGAPVIPPDALAGYREHRLIASVAGDEPRALVRAELARQGFIETREFICAA